MPGTSNSRTPIKGRGRDKRSPGVSSHTEVNKAQSETRWEAKTNIQGSSLTSAQIQEYTQMCTWYIHTHTTQRNLGGLKSQVRPGSGKVLIQFCRLTKPATPLTLLPNCWDHKTYSTQKNFTKNYDRMKIF